MSRLLIAISTAAAVVTLSACATLRGEVSLVPEDGATDRIDAVPTSTVPITGVPRFPVVEITADDAAPAALRFEAMLIDGTKTDGASLASRGPLVLTFVQTTCPISDDERPNLAEAARRHPEVTFVVVHSGGTHDDYVETIEASGLEGSNLVNIDDSELQLWDRFGVTASPSNVLVDAEGLLRSSQGALGADGLDRAAAVVQTGF